MLKVKNEGFKMELVNGDVITVEYMGLDFLRGKTIQVRRYTSDQIGKIERVWDLEFSEKTPEEAVRILKKVAEILKGEYPEGFNIASISDIEYQPGEVIR